MKLILMLAIMSMNIFIVINTLLEQTVGLSIYKIYYIFLFLLLMNNLFYSLLDVYQKKGIRRIHLFLFFIVVTISIFYIVSPHKFDRLPVTNYSLFILWMIPAAIAGIYIHKFEEKKVLIFFRRIYWLNVGTMLLIILLPYITSTLPEYINFGMMTYQNISYISAFTFGLGIFFIFEYKVRYRILYYLSNLSLLPVIFISGGRGGALLVIVYIIYILLRRLISSKEGLFTKFIAINSTIIFFLLFIIVINLFDKEGRIFSYINLDGLNINNESTSGRSDIYINSINAIKISPIFGYGFFNYYQIVGDMPHNFVLEILLIGGIIFFIIFLIGIFYLMTKYIKTNKKNSIDFLIPYILIYPATMLFFSSNFLVSSELWFVIFYILTMKSRKDGILE